VLCMFVDTCGKPRFDDEPTSSGISVILNSGRTPG
jgi:hypothetical protein